MWGVFQDVVLKGSSSLLHERKESCLLPSTSGHVGMVSLDGSLLRHCGQVPDFPEVPRGQVASTLPNKLMYHHSCDKGSEIRAVHGVQGSFEGTV